MNEFSTLVLDTMHNAVYEESDDFSFYTGTTPVMVSAPHNVEQLREGMFKYAEPGTGALAYLLHKNTGVTSIIKSENNGDDANYDEESPYKDRIIEQLQQGVFACLIDLHQMSPVRPQDIVIGSGHGTNVEPFDDLPQILKTSFLDQGLSQVVVDEIFPAASPERITTTVHAATRVPCIQIEMNSKYLSPNNEAFDPEPIYLALKTAIETIASRT